MERTRVFLSCFPQQGQADNPAIFVTAVARLLSTYSDEVVEAVTDPATGLPSRSRYRPALAEIKEACEAHLAPARRSSERSERVKQQLADRRAWEATHAARTLGGDTRVAKAQEAFTKASEVILGPDNEEQERKREHMRKLLEPVNEAHNSEVLGDGKFRGSPWMVNYLRQMAAGKTAEEIRQGRDLPVGGKHRE
jgi:hypothetical protein